MNKKYSFTSKTAALLLAVSLPITVFAGCQNKNTTANAASKQAGNSSNNGSRRQNGTAPNLDQFKQRMADNIKSLVDDKTITQEQADKIVAALTENMQNFGGQNKQQNNNQNNQNDSQSDGQGNSQNNNQGNTQNGQNNGQNRQNGRANQESSALNKLVTDKVITQAQADAVMQKIRGNFNRPQNNQNQQNNNNNNTNSNNTNGNQGA
jgi:hypothetical protein